MSLPASRRTACTVVIFSIRLQQRLAFFGGVFLDDPIQIGIYVRERGHHHGWQPRVEAAVQPAECVAEVADR